MRLNLFVALSILPLTACAESTIKVGSSGDVEAEMTDNALTTHLCAFFGETAYTIMLMRQSGVRMSDILAIVENDENKKEHYDLYKGMAAIAYEEPVHLTQEDREQAAVEFRDMFDLSCFTVYD